MRPRAVARNVLWNGSIRSARGRAHNAVGGLTIPEHTPVARRTYSEHGRTWHNHSAPTAGRAHRHRSCRPFQSSTPQRPAEQGARPGGSPRVPGCPEHAPGIRKTLGYCWSFYFHMTRLLLRRWLREIFGSATKACARHNFRRLGLTNSIRSFILWLVQSPLSGQNRRENTCSKSTLDSWASHKFSRRRNRRLLCACARWSRNAGRCGNHQGTALRPRSMVDRLQNFQRACFQIARVVHLHTGGQIRVQVWRGSLGSFRQRRV